LKEHSIGEVRGWIDQLLSQDLLRVSGDRYPILVVSQGGAEVLKSERRVTLFAIPKSPARRARARRVDAEDESLPIDRPLFERLRDLRRTLARERAVPPYLIFNDRTLAELAARKPTTPEAFRHIKGVGDKKAADLGPAFLACIAGTGEEA
jgi:ATP-dependent DNA helicase RecQ